MTQPRILIVGIGNIFLGDDAFGVEVVQRLMRRQLPEEVCVVDFGIRGIDVTYALLDGYETVILVDATPRGGTPGSLYLLELDIAARADALDASTFLEMHRLDPMKVMRLAQQVGAKVERLLLVGCEPEFVGDDENMLDGLSEAVRLAVDQAIPLIESLVTQLLHGEIIQTRENPVHSLKEV